VLLTTIGKKVLKFSLLINQKAEFSNHFSRLENILDEKNIYCKHGIKSVNAILDN